MSTADKTLKILFCCHLFLMFFLLSAIADAKGLINPFKPGLSKSSGAITERFNGCGSPPEAMKNALGVPFYTDKNYSVVDKEKLRKNTETFRSLGQFRKEVAKMADNYYFSSPPEPNFARCALDWLYEYSVKKALLGRTNKQGENEIKWAVTSLSLSYLQVKEEPSLEKKKKKNVEKWLGKLAKRLKSGEDKLKNPPKNNLAYWMGLMLTATGVAVQDMNLYKAGIKKFDYFIEHIKEDGTLPLELSRGRKALLYHSFSAIPLFVMAELAYANGDDFFKEKDALYKLGDRVYDGFKSAEYFENYTKVEQEKLTPGGLSFLEIYVLHNPKEEYKKFLREHRPLKSDSMNKNISSLFGMNL